MKVRMLQAMASATFSYVAGDEIEVTAEVAKAWEAAQIAEPVGVAVVETTEAKPVAVETAISRTNKKK